MATRKIKDAKDLLTNELIYFKGHAKATYMSDGRTVEEAVEAKPDMDEINSAIESAITSVLNTEI